MQSSQAPKKLALPFAAGGNRNDIPLASQIATTPGAASLADGFPPLTMTPIAAGGVPPSGADMNGILYLLSAIARWNSLGGAFAYDSTFANDLNVNGYPAGARLLRSDGKGFWVNTVDGNKTNPEAAGAAVAGWVPDGATGQTVLDIQDVNKTLSPIQYGNWLIGIVGTMTADRVITLPQISGMFWLIYNTNLSHNVICTTGGGSNVVVPPNTGSLVGCDGPNLVAYGNGSGGGGGGSTGSVTLADLASYALKSELPDTSSFLTLASFTGGNVSKATNGYCKLPNGLILQWGQISLAPKTSAFVTFPTYFPNACLNVVNSNPAYPSQGWVNIDGIVQGGFSVWNGSSTYTTSPPFMYFAIGH